MNINELVKPEYYNDLTTNQAVFWLGNGVTHAPCTCLLAKYGKVDRIMLIFWRALRKLTNYRAAFGGSPPWLRSRFPTEGLSFSIYGNFLPDSRTASIQGFTGPPLFLSVTDRGPEDFPMSAYGKTTSWYNVDCGINGDTQMIIFEHESIKCNNSYWVPKVNTSLSWSSIAKSSAALVHIDGLVQERYNQVEARVCFWKRVHF